MISLSEIMTTKAIRIINYKIIFLCIRKRVPILKKCIYAIMCVSLKIKLRLL